MVDRVIRVVVDPSGARSGLRQVDQAANKTERSFGSLKAAAAGVIAALGVRELARYADTWTLINNRLKLVTDSQEELLVIQREIRELADDTRSSLESTTQLYTRLTRSTEDLGLSQREVLELTESINQAFQVSGASAEEASASVIQFAQGLAAGALRGDELNSVLEQAPRLARAIADGLGVGIGKLRELGSEGELTAEKIVEALQKTAPEIRAEFEQLAPTIDQSFTILENSVLGFVGQVDSALGVSDAFGTVIVDLANALSDSTEDVVLFGLAVQQTISVGFAKAASVIETLDERFKLFQNTLVGVFATVIGDEEVAAAAARARGGIENELSNAEREANERLAEIEANLQERFQERSREFRRTQREDPESAARFLDRRREAVAQIEVDKEREKQLEKVRKQAESLLESFQQETAELRINRDAGEQAALALRDYNIEQLKIAGASDEIVTKLREANEELALQEELTQQAELATEREEYIASLQQEVELLKLTNEEREVQQALIELGKEATIEQKDQVRELIGTIQELRDKEEETFNFTKELAEATAQSIRGLISSAFTGDLDDIQAKFSDLFLKLGQELATSLFLQQLSSLAGGLAGGGGVGGQFFGQLATALAGGATGRQFGGFVDAGQPFVGQEGVGRRPEVFIPRQAGRIEPAGQGAGQTLVIVNEQDPEGLLAVSRTREGVREQRNFVTADARRINRTLGRR